MASTKRVTKKIKDIVPLSFFTNNHDVPCKYGNNIVFKNTSSRKGFWILKRIHIYLIEIDRHAIEQLSSQVNSISHLKVEIFFHPSIDHVAFQYANMRRSTISYDFTGRSHRDAAILDACARSIAVSAPYLIHWHVDHHQFLNVLTQKILLDWFS